ncbi:MAG: UDP-N-acetylmuramoyl-L-alanine--D-glutamate ligase, partial [Termitinemataceae bacterium]
MSNSNSSIAGARVVVMGLGLNGGGLEAARYLATHGAQVTVTDLRDETVLRPSIEKLRDLPIRFVLGKHEIEDFKRADFVVKNPAVRPDSPFLAAAQRIETDISLFLQANPARLSAVTGTKGKSSTASALHWALAALRNRMDSRGMPLLPGRAYLGGNITVSPLTFVDQLTPEDDVVLELSSWQLGDLRGRRRTAKNYGSAYAGTATQDQALLKPRIAIVTTILPDHLDRYGTMEAYVADKKVLYQGQDGDDLTVTGSDFWGQTFARETKGRVRVYQTWSGESNGIDEARKLKNAGFENNLDGWIAGHRGPGLARLKDGTFVEVVPENPLVPGTHQKQNLLACALGLLDLGIDPNLVRDVLGSFPGIEHRLEFFHEQRTIRFYNDTAATIP